MPALVGVLSPPTKLGVRFPRELETPVCSLEYARVLAHMLSNLAIQFVSRAGLTAEIFKKALLIESNGDLPVVIKKAGRRIQSEQDSANRSGTQQARRPGSAMGVGGIIAYHVHDDGIQPQSESGRVNARSWSGPMTSTHSSSKRIRKLTRWNRHQIRLSKIDVRGRCAITRSQGTLACCG